MSSAPATPSQSAPEPLYGGFGEFLLACMREDKEDKHYSVDPSSPSLAVYGYKDFPIKLHVDSWDRKKHSLRLFHEEAERFLISKGFRMRYAGAVVMEVIVENEESGDIDSVDVRIPFILFETEWYVTSTKKALGIANSYARLVAKKFPQLEQRYYIVTHFIRHSRRMRFWPRISFVPKVAIDYWIRRFRETVRNLASPPQPSASSASSAQPQQSQQPAQLRPVAINGFLVISRLPSKALLDAHIPEIFKDVRIGQKQIRLVTGYFYNKLGTLSRKFYNQILQKHAINAGFGYIVPKHKVQDFLRDVQELKKEYEEFERQLKEFLLRGKIPDLPKRAKVDPKYLKIVQEYLKEHGAEEVVRRRVESLSIAGRVDVRLLPFSVDMSVLEEYVDEKVKRDLEREIRKTREEMAKAVEEELRKKARELLQKLEKLARAKATEEIVEGIRREIESIEKTAEEFGVSLPELRILKEVAEAPIEQVGKKIIEAKTSGRVRALLESL